MCCCFPSQITAPCYSKIDVEKFFVCNQCDISGAYDAGNHEVRTLSDCLLPVLSHRTPPLVQIVLCANNIYNSDNMAKIITHELIHAYDDCRAKVDFRDIRHLACTEVSIAGDASASQSTNLVGCVDSCSVLEWRLLLHERGV